MSRLLYALRFACRMFRTGLIAWDMCHEHAEQVADDDVRDLAEEMQIEAGTALLEREQNA